MSTVPDRLADLELYTVLQLRARIHTLLLSHLVTPSEPPYGELETKVRYIINDLYGMEEEARVYGMCYMLKAAANPEYLHLPHKSLGRSILTYFWHYLNPASLSEMPLKKCTAWSLTGVSRREFEYSPPTVVATSLLHRAMAQFAETNGEYSRAVEYLILSRKAAGEELDQHVLSTYFYQWLYTTTGKYLEGEDVSGLLEEGRRALGGLNDTVNYIRAHAAFKLLLLTFLTKANTTFDQLQRVSEHVAPYYNGRYTGRYLFVHWMQMHYSSVENQTANSLVETAENIKKYSKEDLIMSIVAELILVRHSDIGTGEAIERLARLWKTPNSGISLAVIEAVKSEITR